MTRILSMAAMLALAGAAWPQPLVQRLSGTLRSEMPVCSEPVPSVASTPLRTVDRPFPPVSICLVKMDFASCRDRAVALDVKSVFSGGESSPDGFRHTPVPVQNERMTYVSCRDLAVPLDVKSGFSGGLPAAPALDVCSIPVASISACRILRKHPPVSLLGRPAIRPRTVQTVAGRLADGALSGIIFDGLCDGSLQPRRPEWRPGLLDVLAGRAPVRDFDRAFELLLGTFPGSDSAARAAAVRKWAAGLPSAKDSADVFRALTRHYIASGEYDLAIASADEMTGYHAGYIPNALYLKGHAHAFAGRFAEARRCLSEALALKPSGAEQARILYLQAWMLLQEGDSAAAAAILKDIVSRHPSTKYARQARSILGAL